MAINNWAQYGVSKEDSETLNTRFERWGQDLIDGLNEVYPETTIEQVKAVIAKGFSQRSKELRDRDEARLLNPSWYQDPEMIGYAAYTDRFAKNFKGIESKIPYLNELGITYLHLMPLLKPREGENDGGYAVADYRQTRSDLGTMDDLSHLAQVLHENGISLTLDLVLNHVADQHEWAVQAQKGIKKFQDYFLIFPNREMPDEYEKSLPEIFPTFAPGNFTWDEKCKGWVWTTFNSWQWDLNWANPDVFCEVLDVILYLANKGADCLRLDAIAFIWKKLQTDSQNLPEVHAITQALRAAAHIAAPTLILKAEAIVAPKQLVNYLGQGKHAGKVSEVAYHNSLMVQIWSAFASQDARLMEVALSKFPSVPTTAAWGSYIRCHDDIGWAIDDSDAAEVSWNGADHRRFLSDFYIGDFPNSFSRGLAFQPNELTGDRRISGTLASLLGVERALETNDSVALNLAIARIRCAYAMVYGFGGIPLLYMGDEIGLTNDYSYVEVPEHAEDNRWMHRPLMPWNLVDAKNDEDTVAGKVFQTIKLLGQKRKQIPSLKADVQTQVKVLDNPAIVYFVRKHAAGTFVGLFNVSPSRHTVHFGSLNYLGITNPFDVLTDLPLSTAGESINIEPYGALWLVNKV